MADPIVIPPAGGEIVGDSPDRRVEVLSDRDELHATWSRFGPGREGADLHIHREHTDLFYVLDGELTVRLGIEDEQHAAAPGTLVRIPPMVVHGFRNASDAEVRYLNFHAPGGGFIAYMRGVRDGVPVGFDSDDPDVDGVLPTGEAVIGDARDAVEREGRRESVLCEIEALAITEISAEPGAASPGRPGADGRVESFYILEGEVEFASGDEPFTAPAGTWIQFPPGASFELSFPGPSPARLLACHS